MLLCVGCRGADVGAPKPSTAIKSGEVAWSVPSPRLSLRPVSDSQRVYFGSFENRVVAVDINTGRTQWTQTITPPGGGLLGFSFGSVLVLAGDVLVVPNGYVFGFDRATGALRWTFKGTDGSVPGWAVLSTDGRTVYAGGPPFGRLYAIDGATGVARWEMSVATDTVQTTAFNPIVYHDTVYVGVWRQTNPTTGGLAAVDARTGRKLWYSELRASGPGRSGASQGRAAFADQSVFVSIGDGQIVALDRAAGHVKWVAPRPGDVVGLDDDRHVASSAGVVIATSTANSIYGYDAGSGVTRWKRDFKESTFSGISADDSTVYIPLAGGAVIALDARSGATKWVWGQLYPSSVVQTDRALGPPGLDRDFIYIPAESKGYKVRK